VDEALVAALQCFAGGAQPGSPPGARPAGEAQPDSPANACMAPANEARLAGSN
jgi:hypothetical protein